MGMEKNKTSQRDERGASLPEYVLLVAFIAVICVFSITLMSAALAKTFNHQACSSGGYNWNAATSQCVDDAGHTVK